MIHTFMATVKLLAVLCTLCFHIYFIYILIMFVVVSSISFIFISMSFDDFSLITYQWTFICERNVFFHRLLRTPMMSHTFVINHSQ